MTPAAERETRKLDPHIRRHVYRDILNLKENPRPPGMKKMETPANLYRIAVGPGKSYRAIYEIRDQVLLVLVVKVDHRKQVYRHMQ